MKLKEYEKSALKFYTNNNESKRIVTAENFETDKAAASISEDLGNPYRLMFQWIQMEVQELHALRDSIESLKNVEKTIVKIKDTKNDYSTELNDMQLGRTTLKSVWKSITRQTLTTEELMRRIEECEKDIEDWQKLRDYLIQYVPQVVFPKFKRERGGLYFRFLISFAQS